MPDAETPATPKLGRKRRRLPPLAVNIHGFADLVQRSVASLHRDNAAGRLPRPVRIGTSVRWRVSDIEAWLARGCPSRAEFETRQGGD